MEAYTLDTVANQLKQDSLGLAMAGWAGGEGWRLLL